MPNPSLNAYLAKNYLDGAKAEAILARDGTNGEKKRKRKKDKVEIGQTGQVGLRLVDDSDETWKADRFDDNDDALVLENEGSSSKQKQNRWAKVGKTSRRDRDDEMQDGDLPQVADELGMNFDASEQKLAEHQLAQTSAAQPSSSSSAMRAGLKTKEEMRAERIERERKAAEEEASQSRQSQIAKADEERRIQKIERDQRQQETVYRDSTGRKIDVQKDDEEYKRKREDERKFEQEKTLWNKGETQLRNAREQKKREEEERSTAFARHADDAKMNAQMRKVERENDPAVRFLKNKEADRAKGPQKPMYKGHFPPNRFSIRPGYRWDGVERSNGFESKLFQRRNERARRKAEHQAWSQEDM